MVIIGPPQIGKKILVKLANLYAKHKKIKIDNSCVKVEQENFDSAQLRREESKYVRQIYLNVSIKKASFVYKIKFSNFCLT